jgi:AcrR family transcriptional regulator
MFDYAVARELSDDSFSNKVIRRAALMKRNKSPRLRSPELISRDDDGTRDRILRTAEQLYADRGFNEVTVRDLAAAANVNIASIGYYFGSKEGLLFEVYRRNCEPMIAERRRRLEAAQKLRRSARLPAIIEAFIRPALQQVDSERGATFMRLRAVLSGENSELLEELVAQNFDKSSTAYIGALCEVLPHLSKTDVCWRFHFLLGTLYYTARGPHRIRAFSNGQCDPTSSEDVIRELVPFLTCAFQSPKKALARKSGSQAGRRPAQRLRKSAAKKS